MSGQLVQVGNVPTYPTILGIVWVVLVVTLGSRTIDGAVNAGISFVVFQWLLEDALHLTAGLFLILFGLGAITYARHPEGIVEYQTRKSIIEMGRARALAVRAKAMRRRRAAPGELHPGGEGRRPLRNRTGPVPRVPAHPEPGRELVGEVPQRDAALLRPPERRVPAGLDAAIRRGAAPPAGRRPRPLGDARRRGRRRRVRVLAPEHRRPARRRARVRPARHPDRGCDRDVPLAAVPGPGRRPGQGLARGAPHLEGGRASPRCS